LQAGKVPSLKTLVEQFLSASGEAQKQVVEKLEEEAKKLEGSANRFVIFKLLEGQLYQS
jgi:hypothetical protein